jgi:hypothetical protein
MADRYKVEKYKITEPEVEAIKLTKSNIREVYSFIYGNLVLNNRTEIDKWDMYQDIVIRNGMNIESFNNTVGVGLVNDKFGCKVRIGDYVFKHPWLGFVAVEEQVFIRLFSPVKKQ